LRGARQLNRATWSPGGLSQAYASPFSRYSGGGPGSLRPRPFPRSAIGFPKEVLRVQIMVIYQTGSRTNWKAGWMSTSASVSHGLEKRSRRDRIKAIRLKSNVDKGVFIFSVAKKALETADFQLAMKGTPSKIGGYSTRRTQLCVPKGLETISAQPKSWTRLRPP